MVMNPQGAQVEDTVLEVIQQGQLTQWREQLIFGKSIRRFDHFSLVPDRDYRDLGMPPDEIKKLRNTVREIQRKLLTTHTEPSMVYVQNNSASGSVPVPNSHSTMIEKDKIKLMEMLGEGTFAVVKRAIWCRDDGRKVDVAVKILRDMSDAVMEDLKVEAGHLLKLKHPNLIQMHGVVLHPPMMVFELCEGGSLLERLRDDKKPAPLLTSLLDYCLQIVKAMTYLEKEHCVHRDLAARNILLTSDAKTVKICDFGLMRNLKENEEMYIMGPQKRVPFSWCPPESLKHRKFSHASDVWAFGVTVWEVFSLGEEPWIGCRAIEVLKRLDKGERLEKPRNCSNQIYDIVTLCWKVNPEHRPKFTQLKGLLQQAQFNLADVREAQSGTDKNLAMSAGDRVIVVDNVGVTWYGQNMRTTKFGAFLRSAVFVSGTASTKPVPTTPTHSPSQPMSAMLPTKVMMDPGNSKISRPIKGSFIHTGHADPRGGSSWGRPEAIDNIYLKNPILGMPLEPGIPLSAPTAKAITPTRIAPPPPKHDSGKPSVLNVKTNFDPTRPDWNDFDAAQTPSFSPSKIELPPVPPSAFHNLAGTSMQQGSFNPYGTRETTLFNAGPAVPSHHRNPPTVPSQGYGNSHHVIYPTGTAAGIISIPTSKPNQPLVSSQTASQIRPHVPTTSYNSSNVLGNGIGRPPVVTQPIPRPSSDQKTNKDIPIIRPLDYRQTFNTGSKPIPTTAPVSTSSINTPVKPNSLIDRNKNVINELHVKLQPTGGPPSYRPVHAAPPIQSQPHLISSASDPFVVSAAVKDQLEPKRYNEMLEKVAVRPQQPSYLQSSAAVPRPHSTIGTQAVPCLVPTPMPQQVKMNVAPSRPPQSQPSVVHHAQPQPVPPSISHPTLPPPSTVMPTKPLTVIIPEKREDRTRAASTSSQTQVQTRPKEQPKAGAAPAGSTVVTPAGTLPRGKENERQSRIEEEIASVLPPPSRLFYGTGEEIALRSSTSSAPPRPHSVTGVPFPSVVPVAPSTSNPTPAKPIDPLPISLHNVLQPIKLHSDAPRTPPTTVSAPPKERNVDVTSIMNAYKAPVFMNSLNPPPGYYPTQIPLFAIGGAARQLPLPITAPIPQHSMGSSSMPDRATFIIGENDDIVAALDPLAIRTGESATASTSVLTDRANQMEVLYKEASFVEPSRCDKMVKLCDGDIEKALKELKMDYLVDTSIARDKGRAWSALEMTNWDLNRAAESLLS